MIKTKKEVLFDIKNQIQQLDSYVDGEEVLLICQTLGISREKLFLMDSFDDLQLKKINRIVKKRTQNMPLNKIFKNQSFYNLNFYVNNDVLAPRKESELIVELALNLIAKSTKNKINLLDLCCGSGCLGISITKNATKEVTLTLVDISSKALSVARKNLKINDVSCCQIIKSNMFGGLKSNNKFDIIVCNPPYLTKEEYKNLSSSVKDYDPKISLIGGDDGLDFYRILAKESKKFMTKDAKLIVEIGYLQGLSVSKIFENNGYNVKIYKDYSDLDRLLLINL